MKTVTVSSLSLQFDMFDDDKDVKQKTMEVLDLINSALQREPYDIGAQILGTWDVDRSQIEVDVSEDVNFVEGDEVYYTCPSEDSVDRSGYYKIKMIIGDIYVLEGKDGSCSEEAFKHELS